MAIAGSIVARDDTLLGICFAVGQDFGFNPLYLRIAFAAILFWSPVAAFAGYALLGAVVALSRRLFPDPMPAEAASADDEAGQDESREALALAA